jgi:hypothetical protein
LPTFEQLLLAFFAGLSLPAFFAGRFCEHLPTFADCCQSKRRLLMYATTLAGLGHFSILAAFSNISQPMSRPTFFADLFSAHLQTFASLFQPIQSNN